MRNGSSAIRVDWVHEACVDINPADLYYNCDICVAKKRFGH